MSEKSAAYLACSVIMLAGIFAPYPFAGMTAFFACMGILVSLDD